MTDKIRKISKQKGVEMCADLLFTGEATKEIVRKLTESYGISRSSVEKWMKAARPLVEHRQQEAELIMARENEAAIIESAKRLNLTRERVLEEYAKIAFFDIRKIFNDKGGLLPIHDLDDHSAAAIGGIESFDETEQETGKILGTLKKLKISEKRAALDSICKVLGYNAPDKKQITGEGGGPIKTSQVHEVIFKKFSDNTIENDNHPNVQ